MKVRGLCAGNSAVNTDMCDLESFLIRKSKARQRHARVVLDVDDFRGGRRRAFVLDSAARKLLHVGVEVCRAALNAAVRDVLVLISAGLLAFFLQRGAGKDTN